MHAVVLNFNDEKIKLNTNENLLFFFGNFALKRSLQKRILFAGLKDRDYCHK